MVNYGTTKNSKNIIFLPALCLVTSPPLENKILKILHTIIFYTEALGQTICNGTEVMITPDDLGLIHEDFGVLTLEKEIFLVSS